MPNQPVIKLNEYLPSALKRITENEDIALREYFIAQQYPTLRPYLNKHRDAIEDAFALGSPHLTKAMATALAEAASELEKFPPQVLNEAPEIDDVGAMDSHVRNVLSVRPQVQQATASVQYAVAGGANRAFVEKLVANWVKELPKEQQREATKRLADAIGKRVPLSEGKSDEDLVRDVREEVGDRGLAQRVEPKDLNRFVRAANEATIKARRAYAKAALGSYSPEVAVAAVEHDIQALIWSRPDTLRTQAEAITDRGIRLGDVAAVSSIGLRGKDVPYSDIFRSIASSSSGPAKFVAPLADAVFSVLPKSTQEQVVNRILERSWEKAVEIRWPERILSGVADSSAINAAIARGNAAFGASRGQQNLGAPVGNAVSDVFTSVFASPRATTEYLLLTSAQKTASVRMEKSGGPDKHPHTVSAVGATLRNEELRRFQLSLLADPKRTLHEYGLVVSPLSPVIVSQGAPVHMPGTEEAGLSPFRPAVGRPVGFPTLPFLGFPGGQGAPGGGGGASNFLYNLITVPLGFLGRGLMGAFSLFSERLLPWLLSPKNIVKTAWYRDFTIILPLVLIVCIVAPLLFPFISGGFNQRNIFKRTAYIVGLNGKGTESTNLFGLLAGALSPSVACDPVKNPACELKPCVPSATNKCLWPTTGCISQGPYTQGSSHGDGWDSNAIDIGGNGISLRPVISVVNGTVRRIVNACANDSSLFASGCGNRYGNQIVIEQDDGTWIRMGHLAQDSMTFTDQTTHATRPLQVGDVVWAGMPIARTDQNGNSTGAHLHIEIMAETASQNPLNKNINQVVFGFSQPVPACGSAQTGDCKTVLKNLGINSCNENLNQ